MSKERNRSEEVNPLAHSTPPVKTKHRRRKHSTTSSSSSSDSSSESETASDSDAPRGPPPPPPTTKKPASGKPRPPPPPKPSKDAPRARHAQPPMVQMENPDAGEIIQLDVDETRAEAQTVISVIQVNPPGATRVQKVPRGSSSSTFVNLGKNAAADSPPTSPGKHAKKPGGQKPQPPRAAGKSAAERPVPRPRESKTTAAAADQPRPHKSGGKKAVPQPAAVAEASESSPEFSDADDDEPVAATSGRHEKPSVPAATKPQAAARPSAGKQGPPPKKPAGLVFEKAAGDDDGQGGSDRSAEGRARKASDGSALAAAASLNASTGSDRSGAPLQDSPARWQKPAERLRTSAAQSDDDDEEEESETDSDGESDEPAPSTADLKTVIYGGGDGRASLGLTLVGGNSTGVFVETIDPDSAPARAGLASGDHVLRANGQLMVGKTREEVQQTLSALRGGGQTTLVVRHKPNLCRRVAVEGGSGDSFFARAHFSADAAAKGELSVADGDVFDVVDTLPEGAAGYWRARKVDSAAARRSSESFTGPLGLIPNRARADQIVVKRNLTDGKRPAAAGLGERGGLFFRSLRGRPKSTSRGAEDEADDDDDGEGRASSDVVSYERVDRRTSDRRRPVIVLGLFCDTIRTMLLRDSPGLFAVPGDEVETPKDAVPVDVRAIRDAPPGKHCLLILSPPAIEYLQQRTDVSPLTIYVSPVSKSVVKAVKARLAPAYNKNPGYMYEEAARFERNYEHLFSATVPYTTDDRWFESI